MNLRAETKKIVVEIMAEAFKRALSEIIGSASNKEPMELVAWSKAFMELEQEFRQALLKNNDVLN